MQTVYILQNVCTVEELKTVHAKRCFYKTGPMIDSMRTADSWMNTFAAQFLRAKGTGSLAVMYTLLADGHQREHSNQLSKTLLIGTNWTLLITSHMNALWFQVAASMWVSALMQGQKGKW